MIDYNLFHFACPPRTGTVWFLKAVQLAGLGPGFKDRAHAPFPSRSHGDPIRVTLVRHPCEWLASCYAAIRSGARDIDQVGEVGRTMPPTVPFDLFIRNYLKLEPAAVGREFGRYEADTYLRLEDMPHALEELLEVLDVPRMLQVPAIGLPPLNVAEWLPEWNAELRTAVLRSERELLETFDYW